MWRRLLAHKKYYKCRVWRRWRSYMKLLIYIIFLMCYKSRKYKYNIYFLIYLANYANIERQVKNMFCPMTKKECRQDCAWFVEGGCSIIRLNDITDQLDFVQDAVNTLEETISKKNFAE